MSTTIDKKLEKCEYELRGKTFSACNNQNPCEYKGKIISFKEGKVICECIKLIRLYAQLGVGG